jgi:geranylgeranyl diphosphate synthase type II
MPCMDNDVLRRWKPTVWKKFWEYQALLIGDTLNTLAFEILSEIKNPALSVQLSNLLSRSSWFHGMVWWQIDDMYFEENPEKITVSDLLKLHNRKTWALIKASVQWWILLSGKIKHIHKLSEFWEKLWLAFQIKDDLLDVEGTAQETWKSVWWELKWFVHFLWLEKTRNYLNDTIKDCINIIEILNSKHILFLVWYVKDRKK